MTIYYNNAKKFQHVMHSTGERKVDRFKMVMINKQCNKYTNPLYLFWICECS